MTRITLVRHGETDWNKNEIIQGRFDIPLNETGMKQASLTAKHFHKGAFDVIYVTPLIRTKQTAMIIADEINYTGKILVAEDFIERNFGDADGKPIKDYYHLVHEEDINNLETEDEMKIRVMNELKSIGMINADKNVLVVCHSHTIKAILNAIEEATYTFRTKLANCSITTLNYDVKENVFTIDTPNFNHHL